MKKTKFKEYDIHFTGLKQGEHLFEYEVGQKFLDLFDYQEFNDISQKVKVLLNKKSNALELRFFSEGVVNVPCDVTNESFDLPTQGELYLLVKFGETFNDEDDQLLILPNGEHTINIAQYIYEMIVLSVPIKRIHPEVEKGNFHPEIFEKLEELAPRIEEEEENSDDTPIDPRWNELKKLLNNK